MKLPYLQIAGHSSLFTQQFLGLNRNLSPADGEMADMTNLSTAAFPLLAPRPQRGVLKEGLVNPQGILAKSKLAWVDDGVLYYDGQAVDGLDLSKTGTKQLVSMGAYLCIWPDKVFYNTQNPDDKGSMEARVEAAGEVLLSICRQDGEVYGDDVPISDTAPEEPEDGSYWIDTSEATHSLKQYDASLGTWTAIASVFLKLQAPGIGAPYKQWDAVRITGLTSSDDGIQTQLDVINGNDMIIYSRGDDYVVIAGIVDNVVRSSGVTLHRWVPDCSYITECNNRLWGCKYGWDEQTQQNINEIYACKLGDFRNWHSFLGISTDSYTVSVGTDGEFTGAATLNGSPVFFKENAIHKITGSMPSSYYMSTNTARGVQNGSGASMMIVGEVLYYKGRTEVMGYDGSLPAGISSALGGDRYYNAVAGAFGNRYYISMNTDPDPDRGEWALYVYDGKYRLWHKEDDLRVVGMTAMDDSLYALTKDGRIIDLMGVTGDREGPVRWSAVFGVYGYQMEDQKYLSRFNIRMRVGKGDKVRLFIQYDSDGEWHFEGEMVGKATQTFMLPVVPRRCDHCQLRLDGVGDVRIFSIARLLEDGSDG